MDLNAVTVRDTWPLPNLVDVLEELGNSTVFSCLDCLKGFHQIAVDPESIPKLTITTPWGCYSYRVLPFGVINGPSCFSRAIHLAMQPFLNDFAVAYLDDVTLHSSSIDEQVYHVEKVLARFKEVDMRLNSNKCNFISGSIELLGFGVSSTGIKPLASKVDKILSFPRPNNQTRI